MSGHQRFIYNTKVRESRYWRAVGEARHDGVSVRSLQCNCGRSICVRTLERFVAPRTEIGLAQDAAKPMGPSVRSRYSETLTGVVLPVLVPSPSCWPLLSPQHFIPSLSSAQEW